MCGVSTSGTNIYFGIKYFSEDDYFVVQLGNSTWRIQRGAKQQIIMEIDNYGGWSAVGNGMRFRDGDAGLEFRIPRNRLDAFMSEFRRGERMVVRFPGAGNMSSWALSLRGSDYISNSFLDCIRAM